METIILIAIIWSIFIAINFINGYFLAKKWKYELPGYRLGQLCLILAHTTMGILIWLPVFGIEISGYRFVILFGIGIAFFMLWFFGFKRIETNAFMKRFDRHKYLINTNNGKETTINR